jgi:hypothetical protein
MKLRTNAMTHYVGVLDGSGDVWGVRFPDIPGCVGGGPTPKEAVADAAEALRDVAPDRKGRRFAVSLVATSNTRCSRSNAY